MAEKIIIAELDIDMQAAIADTVKLKEEEAKLKVQLAEIEKTQGKLSAAYIQQSANLKTVQADLKTQENIVNKVTQAENTQLGTVQKLEAQNSALRAEQKKLNLTTEEGIKRNKEIVEQINKNTEAIKENSDKQKQGWMNVGQYMSDIQGAVNNIIPGFSKATGAAKAFGIGLNLSLLPITAIVAAIVALITYFKRTEEGSNKLNKILAVFGAILNQVMEVVSKVGEAIFKAFENPKKAISDLWELIKTNIMNRLTGFIDVWKAVGKVLKGVFTLNWDEIKKGAAEFGESMVQVATGVDDLFNKAKKAVKGFMDEAAKEAEQAARIADQKAALRKRERSEVVNDEKDLLRIANLREEAAKKDKYNGEQRLKMIDEAARIEKEMLIDDLEIAKQKAAIHKQEMAMKGESTEALDEQAKLEADVFRLQRETSEKLRGLEKQRQSAINDMKEDAKKAEEEILKAREKAAQDAIDLMNYELDTWLINNRKQVDSSEALIKERADKEKAILDKEREAGFISQNEYNLALVQLEADKNDAISELNKAFEDKEKTRKLEAAKIDFENQQALFEENALSQLERERLLLEQRRLEEVAAAERVGADVLLINKKYQKANLALDKAEKSAKLSLAQGFASNVATIAGENTKVGKAAAAAAATINTYQAATGAYAALAPIPIVGPGLGIAAAAAAIVSGIQQVRKIYATQPGSTPSGESGQPAQASAVSTLQSVNTQLGQGIVSRNTEVQQTQEAQKPIIAVPVDKVTKEQLNESSKIETATI